MNRSQCNPTRQQGAVLLLLMLILLVGLLGAFIGSPGVAYWLGQDQNAMRKAVSLRALGQARKGLLGFAAFSTVTGRGPGFLPCPDLDGDGGAEPSCGGTPAPVGFLPWKTLGLPPLKDGWGQPLWYALSANLRPSPAIAALNSDSDDYPFLRIAGDPSDQVVVLLAPGPARPGQDRGRNDPRDWLELENADRDVVFRRLEERAGGNDQVLGVRKSQWARVVEVRVLSDVAALLEAYHRACGQLPWAVSFDGRAVALKAEPARREGLLPLDRASDADGKLQGDWGQDCGNGVVAPIPPAWIKNEGWGNLLMYAAAEPFVDGGSGACAGNCLSIDGESGIPGLLMAPGVDATGHRPSSNPGDYFEGENALAGDDRFHQGPVTNGFDDRVRRLELASP